MSSKLIIRDTVIEDCAELAATMRVDDVEEILASSGRQPIEVLLDGFDRSIECKTALYNNQVLCMWGVVPGEGSLLASGIGCIWMLTSDLVEKYPLLFYRHCKVELTRLLSKWRALTNYIACSHMKALRWGKRLGFQFGKPELYGIQRKLFVQFLVTLEDLHVRASDDSSGGFRCQRDRKRSWNSFPDSCLELSKQSG